ncbi:MAG: LEPR-XLL domain-containing protein, partial [Planctomycetaceae bacterium]
MRRRQVQRNVRSSVLGTVADSVEVRVLLSADPAMAAVDVEADD